MRCLNKNHLKLIALISMTIDHIGLILFPNILILRILGRLAFPIFAFCIADGLKHTRNVKKYILLLFIFALISQIPYHFIFAPKINLNILFTFLISIAFIFCINKIKNSDNISDKILPTILIILISGFCLIDLYLEMIDYSIFGILLVLIFYYFDYNKIPFYILSGTLIILATLYYYIISNFYIKNHIFIYAILALPIIYLYNNEKGKINLKYLFYIFYPLHLTLIFLIKLICFQ